MHGRIVREHCWRTVPGGINDLEHVLVLVQHACSDADRALTGCALDFGRCSADVH